MPEIDYLPVAVASGANVDSQADFNGSGYQQNGFTAGIALPQQANKVWRQASMMAAAMATFISNQLGIAVLDDGNLSELVTNLTNAILSASAPLLSAVPFNATPVFACTDNAVCTFEMSLTGNVTGSTITNLHNGQIVGFILIQDATGGRTFVWPTNVPGGTIDPTANATSVQYFVVDGFANFRPIGALTSS